MTLEVVSILEELAEQKSRAQEKANRDKEEAAYYKGYADALGLAWDVVFNKTHMSEENISIK